MKYSLLVFVFILSVVSSSLVNDTVPNGLVPIRSEPMSFFVFKAQTHMLRPLPTHAPTPLVMVVAGVDGARPSFGALGDFPILQPAHQPLPPIEIAQSYLMIHMRPQVGQSIGGTLAGLYVIG